MKKQLTIYALCSAALHIAGCTPQTNTTEMPKTGNESLIPLPNIIFLTRDGCVNTPIMRANLDAAISSLDPNIQYSVLNQGSLPRTDSACGYPTPTLLVNGRDLFDLPEPVPPYPAPT